MGATCSGGLCTPATLATQGTTAWALTVSPTEVYWLSASGAFGCPLTGCAAGGPSPFATAHTFTVEDRITYWPNASPPIYASGATEATDASQSQNEVFTLGADGSGEKPFQTASSLGWLLDTAGLYWWDGTEIMRRPLGLSDQRVIIMTGINLVTALAADSNNIYLANASTVVACPKATGQCGTNPVLIAATGSPDYLATEPDAQYVYFGSAKAIYRCPYRGCSAPNAVPIWSGVGELGGMVADGTALYWTDTTAGKVFKCLHGDTCVTPIPVAAGLSAPTGIAIDGSWVYWTLASGPIAVQRAAK
jgi:hypothetical protein